MNNEELTALDELNEFEIEGLPIGRTVPGVGVMFPPETFDVIRILVYLEALFPDNETRFAARRTAANRITAKIEAIKTEARKQATAQQFAVPQGQVLQMPSTR